MMFASAQKRYNPRLVCAACDCQYKSEEHPSEAAFLYPTDAAIEECWRE